MNDKTIELNKWLQIILLVTLLLTNSISLDLSAADAEKDADAVEETPVKQEEPVEPLELRNDRIIAKQLTEGETKWLKVGKSEFLGIFKSDNSGKALGSILILPSPNSSPNTPGALNYLSNELSESGWHTLAISLPEFDFSGPAPEHPNEEIGKAEEKTEQENNELAAITKTDDNNSTMPDPKTWYEQQQTKNMERLLERILVSETELQVSGGKYLILAQGATAELLLELVSSKVINPQGLITLNIEHPVAQRQSKIPNNLAKVTIPTLDVFNVLTNELAKKRKLKQKGNNYRQIYVPGNGIHYIGSEPSLYKRINGWLKINFSKQNSN
ncbi:MAG: hypothetical protein ACI9IA_002102 [Enterobacterales bacterium]|jgi:hypothetical protein